MDKKELCKIAVDAMGGDVPEEIIKGAIDAVREREDIFCYLVGKEDHIKEVISQYAFDQERVESAMRAAYDKLYDPVNEIFALLSPPFSKKSTNTHDPGYISGYIPGTRENGGQYTHAAVWGAMGLFAIGEHEKGMRIVRALSPVRHTSSEERILRYRKEPYALCGDILMAEGRIGEGGWSQYTGSAGWYYRLLCELFGDCQ